MDSRDASASVGRLSSYFPSNTLIYGISRDGSKNFNIRICEHMILSQLRMGARQAKNAPLITNTKIIIITLIKIFIIKLMIGQLLANSWPTQLVSIINPTITKIIIIALIKIFIIKLMTDKIKNELTSKLMLMIQCLFQPNVKIIYILTLIMNSMMRMMLAMFNDGCAMLVTLVMILMITMLLLQCQWFVWELTLELLNLRCGGLLQFQIGIASVYWQCILFMHCSWRAPVTSHTSITSPQ